MHGQPVSLREFNRNFPRQISRQASLPVDLGQLVNLTFGILGQLASLEPQVRDFSVALRAHRDVLACCHRHSSGDQARYPRGQITPDEDPAAATPRTALRSRGSRRSRREPRHEASRPDGIDESQGRLCKPDGQTGEDRTSSPRRPERCVLKRPLSLWAHAPECRRERAIRTKHQALGSGRSFDVRGDALGSTARDLTAPGAAGDRRLRQLQG